MAAHLVTRLMKKPAKIQETTSSSSRIYLSPPHMSGSELKLVEEAFASNWIAPLGPHVERFEREFAELVGVRAALALSSGTAALHLALRLMGLEPGDEVICPTLTFIASASPIAYERASPVFIDSEPVSWNMDPCLLEEELVASQKRGKLPRAAVVVDVFGQSADYDAIQAVLERFRVPLIEDAAESLGATYKGLNVGRFGRLAVFSFNGNKIITTGGGGMLISDDDRLISRARHLASQARDPAAHYQHSVIGYNYRLSNILAAIGRGQLQVLEERVRKRRENFNFYKRLLADLPGIEFMPEAAWGQSTRWLTCMRVDPASFGATREEIRLALERHDIEARAVWKPLHLQPVFKDCRVRGGQVAAEIFERGLCLPSGSSLTQECLNRVVGIVRDTCRNRPRVSIPDSFPRDDRRKDSD